MPRFLAIVPLLVAALVYWPALDNGFSLDDYNWLERAAHAGGADGWGFIFSREPGQLLNPVPRAIFLTWVRIFGEWPQPFHSAVLLLHLMNVWLVGRLGACVSGRLSGLAASFLFALLPAFHEAIFWVAAFFHPLTTTFYLTTLLSFLLAVKAGDRKSRRGWSALFLVALGSAILTKALAFALLPTLLVYLLLRRGSVDARSGRALVMAALLLGLLVAATNVMLGVYDSYLIERGYYAFGGHWPANLWAYLGRLGFLLPETTAELSRAVTGNDSPVHLFTLLGALVVTFAVAATLLRGRWRSRWWAGQLLFCLAPVLPFVFEPVSRYLYLAAVPLSLLIADLVAPRLQSVWRQSESDRRALLPLAIVLLGLVAASWAELRLVDNHYEYREQQMSSWVAQVVDLLPSQEEDTLTVVGLPTLGIDPGLHFEAALRLRLNRPDFDLQLVDDPGDLDSGWRGEILLFDGTNFRRHRTTWQPR